MLPCALALFTACGSSDGTRAVREAEPDAQPVETRANVCPSFEFTMILPRTIRIGETASAVAFATDPDSEDAKLGYRWSATSGKFDKPNASFSQYTCADSGAQVINVTTSDPDGCENYLDFAITCDAP